EDGAGRGGDARDDERVQRGLPRRLPHRHRGLRVRRAGAERLRDLPPPRRPHLAGELRLRPPRHARPRDRGAPGGGARGGGMSGGTGEWGNGRRRLCAFALLVALASFLPLPLSPAQAQRTATPDDLAARVAALLDDPALADAHWGALVVDLETGDTLFARNARRRFIPASNQKLFTTAAALAVLRPGYRYETALYLDGEVRGDTLHGDLVVRGAGDPTLGSPQFYDAPL